MTEVRIEQRSDGIVFFVRAQAGARRNGIVGIHDGALKVAVTQAAEKGKANKAIIRVLCDELGLRAAQIELIHGATSSHKQFVVQHISLAELQRRIADKTKSDSNPT